MERCVDQCFVIRIVKLLLLIIFSSLMLDVSANHNSSHSGYIHESSATSPVVPLLTGVEYLSKKILEKLPDIATRELTNAGFACVGCQSEFLQFSGIYADYTLFNPVQDLFQHQNANERFKNKFLRDPFGKSQIFYFEYANSMERIGHVQQTLPDTLVALTKDPNLFYSRYGNFFISARKLGGMLYIAYRIEFPSAEERIFFENNVKLPGQNVANYESLLSLEMVNALQKSHLDGVVTIGLHMIGGNPAHLDNFINANFDSPPPKTKSCKFDALSDCYKIYARWQEYFFSNSGLADSNIDFPINQEITTHVISYYISTYPILGIIVDPPNDPNLLPDPTKTQGITTNTIKLIDLYNKSQQQYDRVSLLLSNYKERMNGEEFNRLSASLDNLQSSIDHIANVGVACLDRLDSCISDGDSLQPYLVSEPDMQITPLSEEEMLRRLEIGKRLILSDSDSGFGALDIALFLFVIFMTIKAWARARLWQQRI